MSKKDGVLLAVFVSVMLVFGCIFTISHNNYIEVLEVNESLLTLVEEQRVKEQKTTEQWKESYQVLKSFYQKQLEDKTNEVSEWERKFNDLQYKVKNVDIPVYDFTEEEIYMLAQCVEAEAGLYEEAPNSQRYVTQVILNRLSCSKFPNTLEEVIYQRDEGVAQFSVAYDGGMKNHAEVQPETLANVYSVIVHGTDLPDYVLYFYSTRAKSSWVKTLEIYEFCEGTYFAYISEEGN